ncbi:hypothetical protein ACROYT_G017615 [Oculina patagonica]
MSQPPPVKLISERENQAWCAVYGLESAAIIIGNIIIIAAFAITKSLHKKTYLLLISLAVADLLVGAVSLPMYIHVIGGQVTQWWTLDDHVTHTQTAIEIFTSYASIFFLVAIALERLFATLSPFTHDNLKPWVYYIVIASVWVLALLLGILSFLREAHVGAAENEDVFIFIMVMLALSMLIVVVSYTIIAVILLRSRDKSDDFEKRMAVTLLILTVIFWVTWLPFKVINYIFHFDKTTTLSCTENDFACLYHAVYATKFLHYFNSVVNPIVYALRVKDFRKGVRRIFCGCLEAEPPHNPPLGQEKGIDNMVSMQSIDTVVPSMFL